MRDITLAASDRFLFARTADRVVGAMGVVVQPGGTGLVFPPEVPDCEDREGIEQRLIQGALLRLRQSGARFAQLVLPPSEAERATAFEQAGFRHLTDGVMLELPLTRLRHVASPAVAAVDADPQRDEALLVRLIGEINQGSLDCSELDAYRTPEEVLEGHRSAAGATSARWRIYTVGDDPAGMSVAIDIGDGEGWELLFFGIIPKHRGCGLGRAILVDVAGQTRSQAKVLRAACDSGNRYAAAVYEAVGFQKTGLAGIWIHSLGSGA